MKRSTSSVRDSLNKYPQIARFMHPHRCKRTLLLTLTSCNRPSRTVATRPSRARNMSSNDCSCIALTRREDFRLKLNGLITQSRHGNHASASRKNLSRDTFDACERHKDAMSRRDRFSPKGGRYTEVNFEQVRRAHTVCSEHQCIANYVRRAL